MRIGYIGYHSPYHSEWGVSRALERFAGVEVDRYEVSRLDRDKFRSRNYDIVLTPAPYALPVEFWRSLSGVKVAHYFDLIIKWQNRERVYFPPLAAFDLTLSPDGFDSTPYERAGIRREWFQQAFDPLEHNTFFEREPTREVAFIGNLHSPGRAQMARELKRRYDFVRYGHDNECRGVAHARICSQTKVMLATSARDDLPGYWSDRVYLHLACGAFVLHAEVPGLERHFTPGVHLATYKRGELFDRLDYYLAHDDERERIARAGCEHAHAHHTWDRRMEDFWRVLHESGLSDIPTSQVG